jgi:mannose-6-phosphate isomerase-like protein (cupin superfamily)
MRSTQLSTAIFGLFLLVSLPGWAEAPAAPVVEPRTFVSAADIAALVAKAEAAHAAAPMTGSPLVQLAPYSANFEYRTGVGPAATHEKEAELFVVLDGAGSIVIGGKLVGETRRNAENLSGTSIEGGAVQKVAKGDVFIVPENTAHWFNAIDGRLVLMTFHVPRPVPAH